MKRDTLYLRQRSLVCALNYWGGGGWGGGAQMTLNYFPFFQINSEVRLFQPPQVFKPNRLQQATVLVSPQTELLFFFIFRV